MPQGTSIIIGPAHKSHNNGYINANLNPQQRFRQTLFSLCKPPYPHYCQEKFLIYGSIDASPDTRLFPKFAGCTGSRFRFFSKISRRTFKLPDSGLRGGEAFREGERKNPRRDTPLTVMQLSSQSGEIHHRTHQYIQEEVLPQAKIVKRRTYFCFVFTGRVIVGVSSSGKARHCQPETVLKL